MKSMNAQFNAKIANLTNKASQITSIFENELVNLKMDINANKDQVNAVSKNFEDLTNELNVVESFQKISTNAAYIKKHFDYCNQMGICSSMTTTSSTVITTSKTEIGTSTTLMTLSDTTKSGIITSETTQSDSTKSGIITSETTQSDSTRSDSTTFRPTTSGRYSRLNITIPSKVNLKRHNG